MEDSSRMNETITSSTLIIFIIITLTTTGTFAAENFAATTSATSATTTSSTTSTSTSSTATSNNTSVSTGSEPPPPVLDGFSQIQYGVGTCATTVSTSQSNDVIILFTGAASSGTAFNVTDTENLHWHPRASAQFNSLGTFTETFAEYYATSASPLSGDKISVTNALSAGNLGCSALGVSGADTASPFDPSAGCSPGTGVPQTNESTPTTINAAMKVCTSEPSDLLVSAIWLRGDALVSTPAGFTVPPGRLATSPPTANSPFLDEAYERVLTNQTGLPLTWAFGGDSWAMITDAITADGS